MDKNRIKEICKCVRKDTCLLIADLLQHNKFDQALSILENYED